MKRILIALTIAAVALLSCEKYEDGKPAKNVRSQFSSMYRIYPSFYFSSEKMMMIIPLTNDLGGNAVFSCSIDDSRAFLFVFNSAKLGLFS